MQGRGPPLPRFLICWQVYTSSPQCGPEGPTHPYSWTPRPCMPLGLRAQPLYQAQD